jgi:hypothetical protein
VNKNMEELITLDGKQFKLMSDYPLTAFERQQTISDIRKQSGCSSCNKTQSLGNGIQSLQNSTCVSVILQAPASIAVTSIVIGESVCVTSPPYTCPSIPCDDLACTTMAKNVVVRFTNSGDVDGTITPTIVVTDKDGLASGPIPPDASPAPVPHGSYLDVTWTAVRLSRGSNNVCVNY